MNIKESSRVLAVIDNGGSLSCTSDIHWLKGESDNAFIRYTSRDISLEYNRMHNCIDCYQDMSMID